jgi:putative phosphoribosyl transferase
MIIEIPQLRDKVRVFKDRPDAGTKLAWLLADFEKNPSAIIFAIPAGGVPVATVAAEKLHLPLDVAVVSKITPVWNSEVGFGAAAFDGTVRLNHSLVLQFGLTEEDVQERTSLAIAKVRDRVWEFRENRPMPDLTGKTVILIDDGIASGGTMMVAAEALRNCKAEKIIVAVPTGHQQSLQKISAHADEIYCANVRGGYSFAVADAYRNWRDVDQAEAAGIFKKFHQTKPDAK